MSADPRALYYVTAIVMTLLLAWVAWAFAKLPTRKDLTPAPVAPPPVKRNIIKAPAKKVAALVAEKKPEPTETKAETEAKAETETETKAETETETKAETETETKAETETKSEKDSDQDSDSAPDSD